MKYEKSHPEDRLNAKLTAQRVKPKVQTPTSTLDEEGVTAKMIGRPQPRHRMVQYTINAVFH